MKKYILACAVLLYARHIQSTPLSINQTEVARMKQILQNQKLKTFYAQIVTPAAILTTICVIMPLARLALFSDPIAPQPVCQGCLPQPRTLNWKETIVSGLTATTSSLLKFGYDLTQGVLVSLLASPAITAFNSLMNTYVQQHGPSMIVIPSTLWFLADQIPHITGTLSIRRPLYHFALAAQRFDEAAKADQPARAEQACAQLIGHLEWTASQQNRENAIGCLDQRVLRDIIAELKAHAQADIPLAERSEKIHQILRRAMVTESYRVAPI